MRIFYLGIGAIALAACTQIQSEPSHIVIPPTDPAIIAKTKAEREAATKTYVLCLIKSAKKLDDRKSDPSTIAQAMLSACAVEFNRQVVVYRTGDATLEQTDAVLRKGAQGQAIEIVLRNRKGELR